MNYKLEARLECRMKHREIKKRESKYTGDTKRKLGIWPVGVQKGETEVNRSRDHICPNTD